MLRRPSVQPNGKPRCCVWKQDSTGNTLAQFCTPILDEIKELHHPTSTDACFNHPSFQKSSPYRPAACPVSLTWVIEGCVHEADDGRLRPVLGRGELEDIVRVRHDVVDRSDALERLDTRLHQRRPLGVVPELVHERLDVRARALVRLLRLRPQSG